MCLRSTVTSWCAIVIDDSCKDSEGLNVPNPASKQSRQWRDHFACFNLIMTSRSSPAPKSEYHHTSRSLFRSFVGMRYFLIRASNSCSMSRNAVKLSIRPCSVSSKVSLALVSISLVMLLVSLCAQGISSSDD